MNVEQMFNMIIRQIMRGVVNKGVDAGIKMAASGGKSEDEMTLQERKQARMARRQANSARQAARLAGRF